jgi:hypothetical protein
MDARQTGANETGVVRGMARWEIRGRAEHARQSIVVAAGLSGGDAFHGLRRAVEEYVHILAALGHDARGAAELAEQAVREGGAGPPPERLLSSVRSWSEAAAGDRTPQP